MIAGRAGLQSAGPVRVRPAGPSGLGPSLQKPPHETRATVCRNSAVTVRRSTVARGPWPGAPEAGPDRRRPSPASHSLQRPQGPGPGPDPPQ